MYKDESSLALAITDTERSLLAVLKSEPSSRRRVKGLQAKGDVATTKEWRAFDAEKAVPGPGTCNLCILRGECVKRKRQHVKLLLSGRC